MNTPIRDFVARYAESGISRLHMPGHKGRGPLGCEALDITEVMGADALYEAAGIIAQSEQNAAALFGAGRTLYGTEGSSQCVRAMLYLALTARQPGRERPVALAARKRGLEAHIADRDRFRAQAEDSRLYGFVSKKDIEVKVIAFIRHKAM